MKTCPTCQKTYPDDFSLCPRDGAPLTTPATETEAQLAAGLSRRFRLIRRLGKGGMGTVFLAEQVGVGNRPVALKVLNRTLLDNPDFLQRFQNEAGSTGRIHHPNVVTIYESAQSDDGTPYIAMEFLEGESLRDVIKQRGALPVAEVAEILQQAAQGLNAAHKLGIIHRDLKPDNIFLTYPDEDAVAPVSPPASRVSPPPNVQVKIVDFGIAKLRESATHTMTGTVLGTPAYMSYEQASGMRSDELDARSDIYSLGVVVYEMLTGRTPFHSDTPVGYLRKHLMEEPPPFRAVKPGFPVPPQIESVVMKALTKDRNQRYSSVLEFAQEFAQAAGAGFQHAAQPEPQREAVKRQPQATVTPVAKTSVPAPVGDTIATKAAPETTRPPRRKWIVSHWKTIAIIASIVWILGAGICTFKVASDDIRQSAVNEERFCLDVLQNGQDKCDKERNDYLAETLPNVRIGTIIVAFVPVLLSWGFVYLLLFLVRRINRAATTHPAQRKWLASNWKRIGIVASVIWILVSGIQSYKGASDSDSRLAAVLKQECIIDKEFPGYGACLKQADDISHFDSGQAVKLKQDCIDAKDKHESDYNECLSQIEVTVGKELPGHIRDAAGSAFVSILLGWGFAYLLLFLVRRNIRQSAAVAIPPHVQTTSKPPSKIKFIIIGVIALILVGGGVWYFSQPSKENMNPHGTTEEHINPPEPIKGDVSWTARAGTSKGGLRVNPNDGLKYVWIPPGSFQMGCSPGDGECNGDEKPAHQVTISKGFWMGQTEVTVGVYKRFAAATGRQMPPEPDYSGRPLNPGWDDDAMPIVNIGWADGQAYCAWAGGRLPTEAEWEYAARAGSTEERYGPIGKVAWYNMLSDLRMHEVAQKRPNAWGLYDMLGNADEWVNDWFGENYYSASPERDPRGPDSGQFRLLRGGSWGAGPMPVRVSYRDTADPAQKNAGDGFRCVGEVFAP